MQPDVRHTALEILNRLSQHRQTLDSVMHQMSGQTDMWPRRDRALLNALVYGVLRWRGRLDYIISHHSKTPFSRIDSNILNILRLGIFQIGYLSKIPVAAAVDTSVELAKSTNAPWVAGYVNAVLRNAARDYRVPAFPDPEKDPVMGLAVTKSFPKWLIRRWLQDTDIEKTIALCDAINTVPDITLRTNTLLTVREALTAALENEAERIELTDYAPDGVSIRNPAKPIAEMVSFRQGWFQVQDEAAQLVTLFLAPQPGEAVLDACAGLGGKTGHIAQLMRNNGKIVAMDTNASKLNELQSQMKRLHVTIVTSAGHNLNVPPEKIRFGIFDRILLDAPCSGLGVLRRNPDVKWNTSEERLQEHMDKQLRFLDNLAHLVKTEGVLVYAVCSNEPEENEVVINEFLNRHPEFVLDNHPGGLTGNAGAFITRQGYLKTFPYPHNMDGFFSARLKRIR